MWAPVFISVFLLISLENMALCSITCTNNRNLYFSTDIELYCANGCCGVDYIIQYCCTSITYPSITTKSVYNYNGGYNASSSQNKGYIAAIVVPLVIGVVIIVIVYSYLFYCKKSQDSNVVNVAPMTSVSTESSPNQPEVWQTGVNPYATGSDPVSSIQAKGPISKPAISKPHPAPVMPYQQPQPYQTPTYSPYQPPQLPSQPPSYASPQLPYQPQSYMSAGQAPSYTPQQLPGQAPSYMLPRVLLKNQWTQTN